MSLTHETEDRFGDLPDPVVFHILSYLNTKEAFQTCILSKRWNNLTNNLPILILDSDQFESLEKFDRALSQILSVRNGFDEDDDSNSVLDTLDLTLSPIDFWVRDSFPWTDVFVKRMVRYALSHNVRRLRYPITCNNIPFQPIFASQTLSSLDLSVPRCFRELGSIFLFPTHLNLPSLTHLTLSYFRFGAADDGCADPFSAFNKLNTLTLISCFVLNPQVLNCATRMYRDDNNQPLKLRISSPNLCNFSFIGNTSQKLCLTHLSSLKHLFIDAEQIGFRNSAAVVQDDAAVLLSSLQDLPNIRSLTVSSNTLQVLSLVSNLFEVKFTSFYNLESLEVQMKPISGQLYTILCFGKFMIPGGIQPYQATIIPDGVIDCLIQNSPSANVSVIPYKIQDPREAQTRGRRKFFGKKHTKAKQI
ncbi:F-box protein At5g03100-like isoform X1 [Vicia villosa]|uniref:F-box protein At5g03100-like isoform X1 n=1 Tax=Vicia villosa TaxID=3911 RepID=UPI00273B7E0B|nr:F-box protein At5g03100-like isoform X1 [Vicia villosa]